MTTCADIINYIESIASPELAEEWDNVGLLIGSKSCEVKKILVCLDVTQRVVNEASKNNIDMIISHHPLIFKGLKRINSDGYLGGMVHNLIRNNINVYSAHTNFDIAENGLNCYLTNLLGLKNKGTLKVLKISGKEFGLGRIGVMQNKLKLSEFIDYVKEKLKIDFMRLIGDFEGSIENVGVFCGSFDPGLLKSLKGRVDVIITGDVKYHTALEAAEGGLCILDAGHFGTERIFSEMVLGFLKNKFEDVGILVSKVEKDSLKIV